MNRNNKSKFRIFEKYLNRSLLITLLSFSILLVTGCCSFSGPTYSGTKSNHFDGEQFVNQDSSEERGLWDLIGWQLVREKGYWADWYESEQGPPPAASIPYGGMRATFINHSTVLIQVDEINILTDPIWSEVPSPVGNIGPSRKRAPGIKFEDLPRIDLVIISHNHYDHMDIPTLERLRDKFDPMILVPIGNKPLFDKLGFGKVSEMDWWDEYTGDQGIKITFVPARHFANRGICDRNSTLWGGYVINTSGGPVFFAGDTGFGKHFRQIRDRFGPMRFSMLPIGAYKPRWFMSPMHMSPADAVEAHIILDSKQSIGIHYGTFSLADDGEYDSIRDLKKAMNQKGLHPDSFLPLFHGRHIDVPPLLISSDEKIDVTGVDNTSP